VVLDTGDEVAAELGEFVRQYEVETASVTAIGAFHDALLGYFDWQTKQYKTIAVDEQVEVLSLLGDVAVAEEGPSLHLHAVLARPTAARWAGICWRPMSDRPWRSSSFRRRAICANAATQRPACRLSRCEGTISLGQRTERPDFDCQLARSPRGAFYRSSGRSPGALLRDELKVALDRAHRVSAFPFCLGRLARRAE
jgi:hypothetical protein